MTRHRQQKKDGGARAHTQETVASTSGKRPQMDPEPYELLFLHTPHPMYIFDVATLRFLAVNDAAVQRYGYPREEFLGMTARDIRPPEDVPALLEGMKRLGDRVGRHGVCRHLLKDGTSVFADIVSWQLVYDGCPALMVLALDVTEHMRQEEEVRRLNAELELRVMQRTAELEAMNRELEAFAYSVSHDLKAPLRAIDGFSRTLLKEHGPRLTERGRDYLGRVRRAARRLEHLTDDLLRLSQISRSELTQADIDLSGLATAILQELQSVHPERDVNWTVAPELGAQGDADLVRIMLTNLLQNAWKFTSKHDHASIEVGCLASGAEPVFYVKDDGAGFDSVYAEKIFVPFRRLHHASEYEGTGIGLTIAQRIVSRHGGRIWAESSTGRGATFFFTLPAASRAAGA